jgi:PAS domain S-box-containing protein
MGYKVNKSKVTKHRAEPARPPARAKPSAARMSAHGGTEPRSGEHLPSKPDPALFLAAIIDSSDDAIISKDLSGIITSWNHGAERMYGFSAEEAMGQSVFLVIPPDRRMELMTSLETIKRGEQVEHHDTERMHKDGTVLNVSLMISPVKDRNGVTIGASAIARDITARIALEREHRLLEARMSQNERLESLGRLAGGVAHDFNNLLAVILNYAVFAKEEIGDKDAAIADIDLIHGAAERAADLTRQLLAFSKREVAQGEVFNLNDLVISVEQMLQRTIGEHIELSTSTAPDLWPIEADPGQFEQILINLAFNARDAMPGGGLLNIDTENVLIDSSYADTHSRLSPGRHVRMRVSDTGTGMEPDVLARAFEPFFTTKSQAAGTGLGLATVFGIVNGAGGEITLYSEIGVGTTCRIFLPATENNPDDTRAEAEALVDYSGTETVLVVEDESALREVARRILVRNGYTVLVAASGVEALDLAESHDGNLDLLLTDVIMPRMLGNEVAEKITANRPDTRVLYMSGYALPVLASQGSLDPGVSLVDKPFSEASLLKKVREMIDGPAPGWGHP